MTDIKTTINQQIGTITLNRNGKHNSFNDSMLEQGIAAFNLMQNADIRAVILRAEKGVKVWSAGRDVQSLPKSQEDVSGWSDLLTAFGKAIRECSVPVIAYVEGGVWGYACEAVFSCDLIVATPESKFAITPGKLGVAYDINGINTLLQRLGPSISKEMLFTAETINASRLYDLGIINQLVPSDQIEDYVTTMASTISQLAPLSIKGLKQQINDLSQNSHLTTQQIISSNQQRDELLFGSEDFQEGLAAMKAKRKPVFKGQ